MWFYLDLQCFQKIIHRAQQDKNKASYIALFLGIGFSKLLYNKVILRPEKEVIMIIIQFYCT